MHANCNRAISVRGPVGVRANADIPRDAVIARAEALAADGQVLLAMHVIDLVALGPDDEPAVARARNVKADLCRARSKEVRPYPSKGLYKSSALRLRAGTTSWEGLLP